MRRTAHRGPALSPLEARAWSGLLRAHAILVRDVNSALRTGHGLTMSSCDVLRAMAAAPGGRLRMGELADCVMLTPAGLSGVVDRLAQAGLVERQRCDGDARGTYAVLTPAGRRTAELAARTHRESVRRAYTGRIDDAELALLCRLWDRTAGDGRPD